MEVQLLSSTGQILAALHELHQVIKAILHNYEAA